MKCPVDNIDLTMSERSGIEIDYCPTCRGVWLDRGELDKIIERSASTTSSHSTPVIDEQPRSSQQKYYDDEHHYDSRHKKRKKESFLGDLFDF